jgi:protocatechuate 3,4-dioxygenase beta subunit
MRLLAALLLLLMPMPAMAMEDAITRDDYATGCSLTPPMRSAAYPGEANIISYNNLVQPEGKPIPAPGQFVYVSGRVLDERCVPLSEARVEMWNADMNGKFIYPDAGSLANPYPLFAGNGATLTDSEGQFIFYTIFPGIEGGKGAPKLHFRISHGDTKDLFTTMYFSGELRNTEDDSFKRLPANLKPLVIGKVEPFSRPDGTLGLHVHHDITVAGRHKFRRF